MYLLQSFNLLVKVPGLPEDSTSLKIRMLPGIWIYECRALKICSCEFAFSSFSFFVHIVSVCNMLKMYKDFKMLACDS